MKDVTKEIQENELKLSRLRSKIHFVSLFIIREQAQLRVVEDVKSTLQLHSNIKFLENWMSEYSDEYDKLSDYNMQLTLGNKSDGEIEEMIEEEHELLNPVCDCGASDVIVDEFTHSNTCPALEIDYEVVEELEEC